MKKATRKIMALFLSVVMVLAMGISVFAAEDDKVTLTINGKAGAEYSVYQVMSATKLENADNLYKYTVNSNFSNAFPITTNGKEYKLNGNNEICVGDNAITEASDTAAVGAALEKYAKEHDITATATVKVDEDNKVTVDKGYYVIKQTKVPNAEDGVGYVASKAILVNLTTNKKVTAKDDTENLDKTITGLNTETDGSADANTAKIGDKINYKVTTYIPTYGADVDKKSLKFWLYDTFSEGITYDNNVEVYISDTSGDTTGAKLDADKYSTEKSAGAGVTFEINLNSDTIWDNQGKYVTLVYSGTLNEKAVVNNTTGNPNTIELTYTNSPDGGEDHLTDKVTTYTFGLGVKKVDKATGEELDGAKFELYNEKSEKVKLVKVEGGYRVATSDDENTVTEIEVDSKTKGNPTIQGLNEGTYILRETKAPDSYSKVSDITVVIEANKVAGVPTGTAKISVSGGTSLTQQGDATADDTAKTTAEDGNININVYVEDTKGISLPETGSKAAIYCLLGGALLVVMGGVFFGLTSRKKI